MKDNIKIRENERKSQVPFECFLPRPKFSWDLRAGIFGNFIRGEGEGSEKASFPFFIGHHINLNMYMPKLAILR